LVIEEKKELIAMREVFFSFEYDKDFCRAAKIRNAFEVTANDDIYDSEWKTIRTKDPEEAKAWLREQIELRDCLVVLIGETTANNPWINFEIETARDFGKGIVGIYINELEDQDGNVTARGHNPFRFVNSTHFEGKTLSDKINRFESSYVVSKAVYNDIKDHLEEIVEEAVIQAPNY